MSVEHKDESQKDTLHSLAFGKALTFILKVHLKGENECKGSWGCSAIGQRLA